MKKISKDQQAQIDNAVAEATKAQTNLTGAIELYNTQLDTFRSEVVEAQEEYNKQMEELKGVYENIAEEARNYFDERSEKWQSSEAGDAYNEWCDQLEAVEFDEIDLDLPEDLELPEFPDLSEELAPSEPGA